MSSIRSGSAFAEPPSVGGSGDVPRAAQQSWAPSDSIHDRLTVAERKPEVALAPGAAVTAPNGWLTFEAYVAWIAQTNGIPATALTTPAAESERTVEDRRSTVVVPSRRKSKKASPIRFGVVPSTPRRQRLSATVIRRALAKTG